MNKDLTVCDMLIYTRNVMEPSQFAQICSNRTYLYIIYRSFIEIFLLAFLSQIEIMDNEMGTRSFRSKCLKLVSLVIVSQQITVGHFNYCPHQAGCLKLSVCNHICMHDGI